MAVTIPVMAKARIGHFAEVQVLKALGGWEGPSTRAERQLPPLRRLYREAQRLPPPTAVCAARKAPLGGRSASRRGFQLAPIQSSVVNAVLGHGEVVGRRLHAVLIGVLHDGELLGTAQHARFRVVHLGFIRS